MPARARLALASGLGWETGLEPVQAPDSARAQEQGPASAAEAARDWEMVRGLVQPLAFSLFWSSKAAAACGLVRAALKIIRPTCRRPS